MERKRCNGLRECTPGVAHSTFGKSLAHYTTSLCALPNFRFALLAVSLVIATAIVHKFASGIHQKFSSRESHLQGVGKPGANRNAYAYYVEDNGNNPDADGATATILSRASQLSELVSHLDASDVVECYVVTRMAPLANVAVFGVGSSALGNRYGNGKVRTMLDASIEFTVANSTASNTQDSSTASSPAGLSISSGPVLIRKSALAFRYRPRVASASHAQALSSDQQTHEKYFELTLEYGPQRAGSAKNSESIPIVRLDTDMLNDNVNMGKYVSWENEGRVYHSTRISEEWTDAYYMAPISGVVFEKIIQRAVEYSLKRPRYQPFEVVSIPSGNLILRSSGSDDFVWDMFRDLADLYVVIDPLLVPPRDKVQFYVSDPDMISDGRNAGNGVESGSIDEKGIREGNVHVKNDAKQLNPNVQKVKGPIEGSRAAIFYEKFFNCANAIKTGDYSSYIPPPSVAPTSSPTSAASTDYSVHNDDIKNNYNTSSYIDNGEENITGISDEATNTSDLGNNEGRLLSRNSFRRMRLLENSNNNTLGENSNSNLEIIEDINDSSFPSLGDNESLTDTLNLLDNSDDSMERPNQTDEVAANGDEGSENAESDIDRTEDSNEAAEKAAIEAAMAAENAAAIVATNTSSAADTAAATTEAAKAAQKAKDASVAARSKASAEALLSGDGVLMTSVLSSCFSDPKYGIRIKEKINSGSNIDYNDSVEWDNNEDVPNGVEMTIAYVYFDGDVFFRLNLTAPYWGTARILATVPPTHDHPEGHSDPVDWAIFMLILAGTLFGLLVMVHQAGIVFDKRLRFRNFFNPTKKKSDWEYEGLNGENSPLSKGGGFPHSDLFLTVESIPKSMGGDDGSISPTSLQCDNIQEGDLEMAERISSSLDIDDCPVTPTNRVSESLELPLSLRMKKFTPDLVERPSSKSYTKVAMPKQSPKNCTYREVKLSRGVGLPPMT